MATNGENGYVSHEYLDKDIGSAPALNKIRTAGAVSLSPELFEKLYLQPRESAGKSGIRHYLGNPTPIASPSLGLAAMGAYFFYGGGMMTYCGVFELICGNTFPAVVFTSFVPRRLLVDLRRDTARRSLRHHQRLPEPSGLHERIRYVVLLSHPPILPLFIRKCGKLTRTTTAYILLYMGVLCTFYMIAALRTNAAFVALFLWLLLTFFCLAGAFFQTYSGAAALAGKLQVAGGAFSFLACLVGWWILLSLLLASVDFPFQLPLGDLTSIVPGYKSRHKEVADMV
ncbi:hypothetical protein PG996_011590 [Apiospora saccharicola]|uniref:Uncharacterized protein n=1 Tax=Apiospora saccharicola TaxID=335842 RepID=A0ABR1UFH4_9PEZI